MLNKLFKLAEIEYNGNKVKIDLDIKEANGESVWNYVEQRNVQSWIDIVVEYAKKSHQSMPDKFYTNNWHCVSLVVICAHSARV